MTTVATTHWHRRVPDTKVVALVALGLAVLASALTDCMSVALPPLQSAEDDGVESSMVLVGLLPRARGRHTFLDALEVSVFAHRISDQRIMSIGTAN